MSVREAYACLRHQIYGLTSDITTYLVRQGVPNHTAVFISNTTILLLTINVPLALITLALFASVIIFFASFAMAVLSAGLLAFAGTLLIGFFCLSVVISFVLTVTVFATISAMITCLIALLFGLSVVVILAKVAYARKAIIGHNGDEATTSAGSHISHHGDEATTSARTTASAGSHISHHGDEVHASTTSDIGHNGDEVRASTTSDAHNPDSKSPSPVVKLE